MKRRLPLVLFYSTLSGITPSKVELGITTDGSLFIPCKTIEYSMDNKMGFVAGIEVYPNWKLN